MTRQWIVERKPLHDQLAGRLRELIMKGAFRPGEKIQEVHLCERFGVSRTPIREAIRVLATEGFLNLTPSRGASIADPSVEEIDELYTIIGALEGLAGELACGRITDNEVDGIEDLHSQMDRLYVNGEIGELKKRNREIHEAIFRAAGNSALTANYRSLMIPTHAVRYFMRTSAERLRESLADHKRIIVALRARDGMMLKQILHDELKRDVAMLKEAVDDLRKSPVSG